MKDRTHGRTVQVIGDNGPAPKNGPPPPPPPPKPNNCHFYPRTVMDEEIRKYQQAIDMSQNIPVIKHGHIRLGNKRTLSDFKPRRNEVVIDIDRPNVLGNPYPVESPLTIHREQSIEKFSKLLSEQMANHNSSMFKAVAEIAAHLRDGKDVILMCWCHPLACHGDVIIEAVKALNFTLFGEVGAPVDKIEGMPEWVKAQIAELSQNLPCSFGQAVLQQEAETFWNVEYRKFEKWWAEYDKLKHLDVSLWNSVFEALGIAWMEGAKGKFQLVGALKYYGGSLRPEDRVNDNGDKATNALKLTGYEAV